MAKGQKPPVEKKPETPIVETPVSTEVSHSTASVNVTNIRSSATEQLPDPRMVKIKVGYPEDYKGKKMLVDGKEYDVSPETADVLVGKDIAERL